MTTSNAERHPAMNKAESFCSVATTAKSMSTIEDSGSVSLLGDESSSGQSILRVRTLEESLASASHEISRSLGNSSSTTKSVGFDTIDIHEHDVILGCNPGVTDGPPLTISWESLSSATETIDDYEASRPYRRPKLLLRRTKTERTLLLKKQGFSSEELQLAEEHVESIRQSRAKSAEEMSDLQALIQASREKRALKKASKKPSKGFGGFFGRRKKTTSPVSLGTVEVLATEESELESLESVPVEQQSVVSDSGEPELSERAAFEEVEV